MELGIVKKAGYFVWGLFCIAISGVAFAEVARIVPNAGKIGHLKEARWGYNGVSTTQFLGGYIMNIGDGYGGGFNYDLGVIKFELPSTIKASDTINNAQIKLYCWSTGVVWLKVQRYTHDNTAPLGEGDYPDNAGLVDVGIMASAHSDYFSLDVTAGVADDVAAGKTYSSYLITAVLDAQGTPLGIGLQDDYWCVTVAEGWSEASTPHLEIDYMAVPVVSPPPSTGNCISNDLFGLSVFASNWLRDDCLQPNWCEGTDADLSRQVDLLDFDRLFGFIEPLILVDEGTCRVSIHHVAVPSTVETYAAEQLQAAFQLACGVTPQINPASPAAVRIRLGTANRFSVGIGDPSEHAYAVRRTYDGDIELVGNSTAAVMWAVDDFCKQILDVSWPIANDLMTLEGQPQSTISIERLCKVESPDFRYRGWIIGDNTDAVHYSNLIGNWMAHNRQSTLYNYLQYLNSGGSSSAYSKMLARGIEAETTIHNFNWYIPADIYYDTHPEYFPLINGVRVRPPDTGSLYVQRCISNPDVYNIIITKIVQNIGLYPKVNIFGVAQSDGPGGWCECENCVAWDGAQAGTGVYSNRLIHFVNLIADYLAPYYPGKYIGTCGYQETRQPPDFDVSDNVVITFGVGGRNYMRKLTDPSDPRNAAIMVDLRGWLNRAKDVHLWDYYYFINQYRFAGMDFCPTPYARTICEEFGELKALGVTGVCGETHPSFWQGQRVLSYTTARAGWDTSLAFDDILDEFCFAAYGPAASSMKSYHLFYESRIYAHVPVLLFYGEASHLFPPAFTAGDLDLMDSYLTAATAEAQANGSLANIAAVADARQMADKFRLYPVGVPGAGSNVVVNPSAESGSSGWQNNIVGGVGDYSFGISTTVAYSGNQSFQITCNGATGTARWYQLNIPVTQGKNYAASFWIRANGDANGMIELWRGTTMTPVFWQDSGDQWVRYVLPEFTATSPAIDLYLGLSSAGTVYVDDIVIIELPD